MLVMPRIAAVVELSKEGEEQLDAVLRRRSAGQLEVSRARVLLAAGVGKLSKVIARNLKTREVTVSKIRQCFVLERLGALHDAPRSGRGRNYGAQTGRRLRPWNRSPNDALDRRGIDPRCHSFLLLKPKRD
jgi:hypothetical protein